MKAKFCLAMVIVLSLFCTASVYCPPGANGYIFPGPENCAAYYECEDGFAYYQECPEGLLFDEEFGDCDFAVHVDCHGRPFGDDVIWKEKTNQKCQCIDATVPGNIKYGLPGKTCVPSGEGRVCSYSGLCEVPGYSQCFKDNSSEKD